MLANNGLKVCMFLFNNFTHDSRVLKEAQSLIQAGYQVTVIARLDDQTTPSEEINGITVCRVTLDPLPLKVIRAVNSFSFLPKIEARLKRYTKVFKNSLFFSLHGFQKYVGQKIVSWKKFFFSPSIIGTQGGGRSKDSFLSALFVTLPVAVVYSVLAACREGYIFMVKNCSVVRSGSCRDFAKKVFFPLIICRDAFRRFAKAKIIKRKVTALILKVYRPWVLLEFNYRVFKAASLGSYDIFHAHDLNTLMGAYAAAKQHGAELIYDSHELYLERNRYEPYKPLGKWVRKRLEAFLIRRATNVITVNESIAKYLSRAYRIKRPVVVMNVPDLRPAQNKAEARFSLRRSLGIADDYRLLLYSGAITYNRGLEKLICALAQLPQCFLVMMGYGNDVYKESLLKLAEQQGVIKRCRFFGPVPSEQVTSYADSADIGIAPIENACLSYYYCSPNKLFEYILAGLPVVASNFPEMAAIINEFEVGALFDPDDPDAIAAAVRQIFASPGLFDTMKEKAQIIPQRYSWAQESQKLLGVYRAIRTNGD